MSPIDVSIIIISYNTRELLHQTLKSINTSTSIEIIVIDNGSTDGSLDMLSKEFPQAKCVQNHENTGFAAANNKAARLARGTYLLLLNSDTKLLNDPITQLVQKLGSLPANTAAITPQLILPSGKIDIACHRGIPTPWNSVTYFAKLEKLFPKAKIFSGYHQLYKNIDTAHYIDATSATAMLIKTQVFNNLQGFDEQFFFYAEDLDLCKRINDSGHRIFYEPSIKVIHQKSASGKQSIDPQKAAFAKYHFWHTMKLFYQKHYTDKYPAWLTRLILTSLELQINKYKI